MGIIIFILDAVIALSVGLLARIISLGVLLVALGFIFYFGNLVTHSLQHLDQHTPLAPLSNLDMRGEK